MTTCTMELIIAWNDPIPPVRHIYTVSQSSAAKQYYKKKNPRSPVVVKNPFLVQLIPTPPFLHPFPISPGPNFAPHHQLQGRTEWWKRCRNVTCSFFFLRTKITCNESPKASRVSTLGAGETTQATASVSSLSDASPPPPRRSLQPHIRLPHSFQSHDRSSLCDIQSDFPISDIR